MESLSIMEFRQVNEKPTQSKYNISDMFGFVISVDKTKLQVNDITNSFYQGEYDIKTKYAIIYLYDFMNDNESKDFIAMYGGELHNKTSANITVLTYFSTDTAKKWSNVYNEDKIRCGDDIPASKIMETINTFKNAYNVNKLPAMVIIKRDKSLNEESFILPLENFNKINIKRCFDDVIKKIDSHCGDDFSVIRDYILGPDGTIIKSKQLSNMKVQEYIKHLVDDEAKVIKYGLDYLAVELGISTRTLYNKMHKVNSSCFTRDECFFIALRFGVSIPKLNSILRNYNHVEIGMGGRDGVIYKALIDGKKGEEDLIEINKIIEKKYGLGAGIINNKISLI